MEKEYKKPVQSIEELEHYNALYQKRIVEQNEEILKLSYQMAQMMEQMMQLQQQMAQMMGVNVNTNDQRIEALFN